MFGHVLLLSLLGSGVPASCDACDDRGTRPCSAHKGDEHRLEEDSRYCSYVIGCRDCGGTLAVDCERCSIGDARVAYQRQDRRRWLESKQEHFDLIGTRFLIAWSEHFELWWNGGKVNSAEGRLSEHGALHLYLRRLEQLYEDFKAATGARDGDFSTRFRVMVWDRPKHHQIASARFCSQPNPDVGVKTMGAVGYYTVFLDPARVDPDESHGADLYRNILHNVSHLLLANAWNAVWPSEHNGGWIDEGVAHYFEDRLDRRCTNFCYREQDTNVGYKGGWWRQPVKRALTDKKRPSFAEVAEKRTDQLTLDEHPLCWSWCEFLIAKNPEGFGRLCRAIKSGRGYRDALKEEFGYTPFTFEEAWAEHVRTSPNYKGK